MSGHVSEQIKKNCQIFCSKNRDSCGKIKQREREEREREKEGERDRGREREEERDRARERWNVSEQIKKKTVKSSAQRTETAMEKLS